MKKYLVLLFALFSIVTYSQQNSIICHKKSTRRVAKIEEFKRVKVVTDDGERYIGKFTIVDSTSIVVHENVIPLKTIVKLKPKSLFGSIVNPIAIGLGSLFVYSGILAAAQGGNGSMAVVPLAFMIGTPLILVPAISSSYKSKDWNYSIRLNNEKATSSNQISLGKAEQNRK